MVAIVEIIYKRKIGEDSVSVVVDRTKIENAGDKSSSVCY